MKNPVLELMKRLGFAAAGLVLGASTLAAQAPAGAGVERRATAAPSERPAYRLGAGDVIDVVVWKEPDFSALALTVRGDGRITLPFLKELTVAGLTPAEAEALVAVRLKDFVKTPEVSVVVKQQNSEKVFVMGMVTKPGPIVMQGQLTVIQALSAAGGLAPFAKKRKIYVLRETDGKPRQIPFDYDAVLKGRGFEQNIALLPNDTIIVP